MTNHEPQPIEPEIVPETVTVRTADDLTPTGPQPVTAEQAAASVPTAPSAGVAGAHDEAINLALERAKPEVVEGPKLVLGGLAYQCRSKAPGMVTASISRMAGLLAKARQSGSLEKAVEDDPDLGVSVSMVPDELFELAHQLVIPAHREALMLRWRGDCADSELFDSNDLMEALVGVLPKYTGQSVPKR